MSKKIGKSTIENQNRGPVKMDTGSTDPVKETAGVKPDASTELTDKITEGTEKANQENEELVEKGTDVKPQSKSIKGSEQTVSKMDGDAVGDTENAKRTFQKVHQTVNTAKNGGEFLQMHCKELLVGSQG